MQVFPVFQDRLVQLVLVVPTEHPEGQAQLVLEAQLVQVALQDLVVLMAHPDLVVH